MSAIYLDWAATTPMRPEAAAAMIAQLGGAANPSSLHAHGRAARGALDDARVAVAAVLRCSPSDVVFTGSGSESDGLAIAGVARARAAHGRHLVTTAIEHAAVLRAVDALEADGWTVTRVAPGPDGVVDPAAVAAALRPDTTLVSIMLVNNELGTIQPVRAVARLARERGITVHTDAVQAAGFLPLDVAELEVDLLTLTAHKFGGPAGVGALYVRRGTPLTAIALGGAQERGRRAGTENVAGIAGLARALSLAEAERADAARAIAARRDRLEARIAAEVSDAVFLGARSPRAPHIASIAFPGRPTDAMLVALDLEGVSASAGSACASGSLEPSHVVAALALPAAVANGVVRFSVGRTTTDEEVERASAVVGAVARRMISAG